jgi:hypothetical protein
MGNDRVDRKQDDANQKCLPSALPWDLTGRTKATAIVEYVISSSQGYETFGSFTVTYLFHDCIQASKYGIPIVR